MDRFLALALFAISVLATGCIGQPYVHGNNPWAAYNRGYVVGASLAATRQPPIMPDPMVQRVSPEIASYARQAAANPKDWYTCNDWVYNPDGNAMYYVYQSVYTDYNTRELRLTQTPPRPQKYGSEGLYSNSCYHAGR